MYPNLVWGEDKKAHQIALPNLNFYDTSEVIALVTQFPNETISYSRTVEWYNSGAHDLTSFTTFIEKRSEKQKSAQKIFCLCQHVPQHVSFQWYDTGWGKRSTCFDPPFLKCRSPFIKTLINFVFVNTCRFFAYSASMQCFKFTQIWTSYY